MASSPEYDKEPKAPDKSVTTVPNEDSKLLHNSIHDQQLNSDPKSAHNTENAEAENNQDVEALDDKSLQALLEEAIAYKGPKDREGKSSLFKELLEEAEQDDQACEAAAARSLGGCRGCSLQDLVAALAAEPAAGPRRHNARRHAPAPSNVSTRATQGGSLPSGVDTSSLLSEEPARGAGYLATVRCVNPPPLAERRVSASDANAPHDLELLNRRSKPTYPMTYTARATLEIGSGSVCSGRAVTTTTASNQVRTPHHILPPARDPRHPRHPRPSGNHNQIKLMDALRPRVPNASRFASGGGGEDGNSSHVQTPEGKDCPRGPIVYANDITQYQQKSDGATDAYYVERTNGNSDVKRKSQYKDLDSHIWNDNVNRWYSGLAAYANPLKKMDRCHASNLELGESNLSVPGQYTLCTDYRDKSTHEPIGLYTECTSSNITIFNPTFPSTPSSTYTGISCESIKDYHKIFTKSETISEKNNACAHREVTNYLSNYNKKTYSSNLGKDLVAPILVSINPRNVRSMSIGAPPPVSDSIDCSRISNVVKTNSSVNETIQGPKEAQTKISKTGRSLSVGVDVNPPIKNMNVQNKAIPEKSYGNCDKPKSEKSIVVQNDIELVEKIVNTSEKYVELKEISTFSTETKGKSEIFMEYVAEQKKLFEALADCPNVIEMGSQKEFREFIDIQRSAPNKENHEQMETIHYMDMKNITTDEKNVEPGGLDIGKDLDVQTKLEFYHDEKSSGHFKIDSKVGRLPLNIKTVTIENSLENVVSEHDLDNNKLTKMGENRPSDDRYVLAELPNNAYIFLTLPKRLLTLNSCDDVDKCVKELETNNNIKPYIPGDNFVAKPARKKKEKALAPKNTDMRKETFNKNALKVLLFENQLKGDRINRMISIKSRLSPIKDEVDSAIPFSCITTPEVVASCNTTSSTSQSAVAVDAKPLQLGSSYRAVASITGGADPPAAPPDTHAHPHTHPPPPRAPSPPDEPPHQPRSVIPSSFNGLPLSRPNYGSTATTAPEEYKKSLDENGNSVQGFSSPLAGSAQHKKPRRKKSSKNETVIDCRQIDGYQGDKDVNELLRFIESNAEGARAPKLSRAKHRDDADDKAGKKRSTERRKDKDKVKRATSLEEVSRTKLEDLTAGPRRADPPHHPPAGKPERRSWGDAREPDHDDPATELTDFQTVTKKRKQRRRADEPAPRRPRAPSPPGPRLAPPSAPPSERSNDSNDDLDSAHSPPPAAPASQPYASYADIARTRHNIPDLIESCNFYAEGEGEGAGAPPPQADADGYPALEARAPAGARARDGKPAPPERTRAPRKERAPGAEPAADCPAPDVVADRRPPVILLDAAARPGDMDGVTFGFDINEQLLSGPARRPRCDLVRDALEGCTGGGVAVRAGCAALRYVPPDPPPDTHHLHQIIDYVGNAWEDVVRLGGGKVRYFSE